MSETGPAEPYFPGPWSQPVGSTPATACDVALGGYPPPPPPGTVPVEYLSPTSGRVPPGYPPPAPGGPPVAWAQPGFGGAPRNAGTDGFAVASLVLGILSGSLLAIIFGIVALGRIRRDGTGGRGLAVAGIVFGCLWPTVVIALAILGGGSSASQSSADGAVRSAGGTSGAQPTPSTPGSLAPSPAGTPLIELADLPKAVADYRTPLVRAVDPAAREGALEGYRAVYTGPTARLRSLPAVGCRRRPPTPGSGTGRPRHRAAHRSSAETFSVRRGAPSGGPFWFGTTLPSVTVRWPGATSPRPWR
jgi:hypothetical protein